MSQQIKIDYQGISIKVQAQCDTAIHSLCRIDKVLDRIHKTANTLETEKVKEYEAYLIDSKFKIKNEIECLQSVLEKYKTAKAYLAESGGLQELQYIKYKNDVESKSAQLTKLVNDLTGAKLAAIDQMINEGLLNLGQESAKAMLNKIHGVLDVSNNLLEKINEIDDISLRELTYKELLKETNKEITFAELLAKATNQYDILLGKKTEQVIQEYKEELKSIGIKEEVLNKVSSIKEATEATNKAITDEKVRKETLKIIIKAIKSRGFIVDTKKNLKIDREKDAVKLVALKASGQKAEFAIQLNGKFMYRFDNYEGQACKKDIEPFLEDLKNIYDINIMHEEVIWKNPDKIQTQKYQYINKNKGTN